MSKYAVLLLASMAYIFFSAAYVLAQNISADLSQKDVELDINSISVSNLIIKNLENKSYSFQLVLKGDYPKSIAVDNNFRVEANSTKSIPVTFNPTGDIGRFNIILYAETIPDKSFNFSIPISLWVKHPEKYIIKDFKSAVDGSKLTASITLKPHDKLATEVEFKIFDLKEKVVKSASLTNEIDREITLDQVIDISDLPTGKYELAASIKGTNLTRSVNFDVGISKNIKEERKTVAGLLFDEVQITLYNYGNLVETDYRLYEQVAKNRRVTLITNATDIIKAGDTVRYEFTIDKIRPGETISIIYRLENSDVLITTSAAIIIIIGLLLSGFVLAKKPKVKKKVIKTGRGQYSVIIEIKSPKLSNIKEAVLKDFVQPSLKVSAHGFGLSIKDSQLGKELVWRLGELEKGSVKALNYSIETDSPHLKLSSATLTYITKSKRKGTVRSNEVIVY